MLKKLTEEKLALILDSATCEFGEKGLSGASINGIAKRSHVSVGVIYKYYKDKDDLFRACLNNSIKNLHSVLSDAFGQTDETGMIMRSIVTAGVRYAKDHPQEIRMYHEITAAENSSFAKEYAKEIEGETAVLYTDLLNKAKEHGVRLPKGAHPASFAFFFDNLLMMLHFSLSCEYYKERMHLYLGDMEEDFLVSQLLLLLERFFVKHEEA